MGIYSNSMRPLEDAVMRKAEEYLSSKYGESFSLRSFTGTSVDISYYELLFSCERFPGRNIRVIGTLDERFSDDYYGILKYDEYCGIIKGIVNKHIAGAKVFLALIAKGFPDGLNEKVTLSQALEAHEDLFFANVCIFAPQADHSRAFVDIIAELKAERLPNRVALYSLDNENYSEINSDNYKDIIMDNGSTPVLTGIVRI